MLYYLPCLRIKSGGLELVEFFDNAILSSSVYSTLSRLELVEFFDNAIFVINMDILPSELELVEFFDNAIFPVVWTTLVGGWSL